MFSRNREEEIEQVKEKARQEMEAERLRIERERQKLEIEREKLERLKQELEQREDKLEELEDHLEDLEDEIEDHEDELEEVEDAESLKDLLDVVGEKIPTLMRGIDDALITPEVMKKKAESIAIYYKTLVEAGMDKDTAEQMAMIQSSEMNRMVHGYRAHHVRPRHHRPHPPTSPTPPTPPKRADDIAPSRRSD